MINTGDDPNVTSSRQHVNRKKTVSVSQGWMPFETTDTVEGVIGVDNDYKLLRPKGSAIEGCEDADIVAECFRFRSFDGVVANPKSPTSWTPVRETMEDEIPAFLHCPRETGPLDTTAVMFFSMNMAITKVKKGQEGTADDALMR